MFSTPSHNPNHYGVHSFANGHLDDGLENIAGLQFLPFVDTMIGSSDLALTSGTKSNVTAFFSRIANESEMLQSLNLIMLSTHLGNGIRPEHLNYLKAQEPIGCRDVDTQNFLQANGVKAYSPSSLMLLMKNPISEIQERDHIYLTDVKLEHKKLLPPKIGEVAVSLKYEINSIRSYKLVERFGSARLVITENFQHALCCVAMETPVIYISTTEVNLKDKFPVTGTLGSMVHMVDMLTAAKKWFQNFTWGNIAHNPNPAMLMRLRATSWNVIRRNQHLYDAAVRFGVVPMSPPLSLQDESKLVFYLVFSTSINNSIDVYGTSKNQSGQFNWRHWRCIESIFYHHPTAEVKVYSNTLPHNTFDVLTEAGYSIQVQRYRLEQLLQGTPASSFVKKLKEARRGPHWYSNVSNLLRILLLYQWGGIYMDTDVIVLRPLHHLKSNTLGWVGTGKDTLMNSAFAKFEEKGNQFLKACLEEFARNYNGKDWGNNGPRLLTRVYRASKWNSDIVNVVDYRLFYLIHWSNMNQECFMATGGKTFDTNMKILKTVAFVLHTNSKFSGNYGIAGDSMKNGTICKHVLNAYCVLCDQIYIIMSLNGITGCMGVL